jgi:phosphopantothenoylcysteine decarboxylase
MNTAMWNHPVTKRQLKILTDEWGVSGTNEEGWVSVLHPIEKSLACGDIGNGAMMDWKDIVNVVEHHLGIGSAKIKDIRCGS